MTNKQRILKRLKNVIRGQALVVREDKTLTQEEKIEQLQVLADLMEVVLEKQYEEEKRIDINKLKEELEEQTRNGRQDVYVNAEDLKRLNPNIQPLGDRIYIKKEVLQKMIDKYEAKQKPDIKIKKRLINTLKGQINVVKEDPHLNKEEKKEQLDIIFKTMTFIAEYERQNNKEEQKNNTHNNNDEFER